MNMEIVWITLEVMWKGMAGIFAAILVIMGSVLVMRKVAGSDKNED